MAEIERPEDPLECRLMRRALELARNGLGIASPNPMVGAVVLGEDGRIVGEGWHEGPGTPHAEIVALTAAGERARGGTLFVTLEPCSHHGRTPPCAPAVRDAGVARVVVALRDPNPVVDGRGLALLRSAGIEVAEGVLAEDALALVAGFARYVTKGVPLVILKMAASLDGKIAARDGSSRWISGRAAREDVHRLRAGSDAVLVGAGTIVRDDPALTVRLDGYRGRQPLRVVVDGRGRIPAVASILDGAAPALVATTSMAGAEVRAGWEAAGGDVAVLDDPGSAGFVSLPDLIELLGKRDVQTLLIEGGPTLAWSALQAGIVDRFVLYLAPKLIGGQSAPGILGGQGVASIGEAMGIRIADVERVGEDLKVVADVHRDR